MPKLTRITIFGIRLATVVLVVYWIALFTGTHMPSPPRLGVRVSDKVHHFTAFFGLATLLYWVIPAKRGVVRKVVWVLLIAGTYAAFDEWTQRFSPRRVVDIRDFLTNLGGILAATAWYLLSRAIWIRFRRRQHTSPPDLTNQCPVGLRCAAPLAEDRPAEQGRGNDRRDHGTQSVPLAPHPAFQPAIDQTDRRCDD